MRLSEIEEARHITAGFLDRAYRSRRPEKALEYWEDLSLLTRLYYKTDGPAALAKLGAMEEARKCLHD